MDIDKAKKAAKIVAEITELQEFWNHWNNSEVTGHLHAGSGFNFRLKTDTALIRAIDFAILKEIKINQDELENL